MNINQKAVELSQGRIHYKEFGNEEAPAILFVHGFLANSLLCKMLMIYGCPANLRQVK